MAKRGPKPKVDIKQYISTKYPIPEELRDNMIEICSQMARDESLSPKQRLEAIKMVMQGDALNLKDEQIHTPKEINVNLHHSADKELDDAIRDIDAQIGAVAAEIAAIKARETPPVDVAYKLLPAEQSGGTQPT